MHGRGSMYSWIKVISVFILLLLEMRVYNFLNIPTMFKTVYCKVLYNICWVCGARECAILHNSRSNSFQLITRLVGHVNHANWRCIVIFGRQHKVTGEKYTDKQGRAWFWLTGALSNVKTYFSKNSHITLMTRYFHV